MSDIFDHQMDAFDSLMDDRFHGEEPQPRVRRSGRVMPHIFNDGWDEIAEQSKYLPTIDSLRKLRF